MWDLDGCSVVLVRGTKSRLPLLTPLVPLVFFGVGVELGVRTGQLGARKLTLGNGRKADTANLTERGSSDSLCSGLGGEPS